MERAQTEAERCQYQGCKHKKEGLAPYCSHHGGVKADVHLQVRAANSYRLDLFQARMDVHASDPNIKNLRGEIGILRMLIEARLNNCKDDYDLLLQSAAIATLVQQANALVSSCHRIETLTGQLLDKQSLAEFAVKVVQIIADTVEPELADEIADKIIAQMPSDTDA